jgi:hypothetical protein
MAKEYQAKKNNPHLLPHNIYMQVLYVVRDYDRLKDEYASLDGYSAHPLSGTPRSGGLSNPTEDKGVRRAYIHGNLHAIEQALMRVPSEYRDGVMWNVTHRAHYPKDADAATYRRWKQRFIYQVAKNLEIIHEE